MSATLKMMHGQFAVLLAFVSWPVALGAYQAPPPTQVYCPGKALCKTWSNEIGKEFQNGSPDKCLYGHTDVENYPHGSCSKECHKDVDYECACVSKEDAEEALSGQKMIFIWIGVGFLIGTPVLLAIMCCFDRMCCNKKGFQDYDEVDEYSGDEGSGTSMCACILLYVWPVVTLIVGIVFVIIGLAYDVGDYWSGCDV